MNENTLTIYWSPSSFKPSEESWNLLYPEPELVRKKFSNIRTEVPKGFFACPSIRASLHNLFALKAPIDDEAIFPPLLLESLDKSFGFEEALNVPLSAPSKLRVTRPRASSLKGYINIWYNYQWLFVAEESCVLKLSAPYYPPKLPAEGAILAGGEFDIGKWFRPINLDYHIPITTEKFVVSEGDELAYVKFETLKKVVLKRFSFSNEIHALSLEMSQASSRYSGFKSLSERYKMAKQSKIKELLLSEIKKNLID